MKGNIIDYMEMAQNARYGIEKESDRLMAKLTQMEDYKKTAGRYRRGDSG